MDQASQGWYPRECKRKRGRPEYAWDEEMKKTCGSITWPRRPGMEETRRFSL